MRDSGRSERVVVALWLGVLWLAGAVLTLALAGVAATAYVLAFGALVEAGMWVGGRR